MWRRKQSRAFIMSPSECHAPTPEHLSRVCARISPEPEVQFKHFKRCPSPRSFLTGRGRTTLFIAAWLKLHLAPWQQNGMLGHGASNGPEHSFSPAPPERCPYRHPGERFHCQRLPSGGLSQTRVQSSRHRLAQSRPPLEGHSPPPHCQDL